MSDTFRFNIAMTGSRNSIFAYIKQKKKKRKKEIVCEILI